jgi:hypothetical protein
VSESVVLFDEPQSLGGADQAFKQHNGGVRVGRVGQ